MQKIQHRLGLAFCAALAIAAVMAPTASATVDFPHEEEAGKWTGIAALKYNGSLSQARECGISANCSFEATGPAKQIMFGFPINCGTTTIKGEMGATGVVTFAQTGCLGSSSSGSARACRHTLTGEYWLRYTSSSGGAVMFGRFDVEPSGLPTPIPTANPRDLAFGVPSDDVYTKVSGAGASTLEFQQAEFEDVWYEKEVLIGAGPGQGSKVPGCAWPELS